MSPKYMKSIYAGTCSSCACPTTVGAQIYWQRVARGRSKVWHKTCYEAIVNGQKSPVTIAPTLAERTSAVVQNVVGTTSEASARELKYAQSQLEYAKSDCERWRDQADTYSRQLSTLRRENREKAQTIANSERSIATQAHNLVIGVGAVCALVGAMGKLRAADLHGSEIRYSLLELN